MSSNNATNEIRAFLESCFPSLADLEQSFLSAGVTTCADLLAISGWDYEQIKDYFANDFHKGGDAPDREPLKPLPAYVLFLRLAEDKCVCGECEDPLPPERMCPKLVSPATMRTPPSPRPADPLQLSTDDDEAIARLLASLEIGQSPSPVDTTDDLEIARLLSASLNTTSPSTPPPRTPPPRTPPPPPHAPRLCRARPPIGLSRAPPLKASLKHTLLRCDRPGRRSHRQPPMSFFVDYAVEFSGHGLKPQQLVTGVPNCIFRGYPSLHAAHAAFNYAQERSWTRISTNPAAAPITTLPQPMTADQAYNALNLSEGEDDLCLECRLNTLGVRNCVYESVRGRAAAWTKYNTAVEHANVNSVSPPYIPEYTLWFGLRNNPRSEEHLELAVDFGTIPPTIENLGNKKGQGSNRG
ncbi:hypothetical protein B0H14DRAFT_2585746 [Mycena olivaceomarginata]|nr:hypothetical protein B0H14DRAFT_2585746 [Mycena olivaceomarginata]